VNEPPVFSPPKAVIAVTSGEPAGIGPDICLALARRSFSARIVVLGDRDLEIHLQQPAAYFPSFLALWVSAPVRQRDVERYGTNWWRDPAKG